MKIIAIATSRVPSSTANSIQVMKACHAMSQLGHSVQLLVPAAGLLPQASGGAPAAWPELAAHYGLSTPFDVTWLPGRAALKRYDFSLQAAWLARQQRAGLVYTWALQAAVAAQLLGLDVMLELHGPPEGRLGPLLFRAWQAVPGRRRLLPITQALAKRLPGGAARWPAGELVIAPNGVELERYANLPAPPAARQALGLPETLTVAYTGHFYAGRGMELLYELARRFPQVHFLWVGGTPDSVREWQTRLAEPPALSNVTLTGFIENRRLAQYQAAAEILLMPYERFIAGSSGGNSAEYCSPMKMFEYMAAGRAIISSDLPVIAEVLGPQNAVLCPPEDVDAWAHALAALLADPARREALAVRAHQDVQSYSWLARAQRALAGWEGGR